ncbi:hypothetical protein [Bacteroides sp. 214]|uniref:hypothetical protein n=1 Tax=Bacteroides sp. 214 TaxID=2302935 RepID=UPI0013D480FC|nr:hypothetical protein [Bacteroides sp. 214]
MEELLNFMQQRIAGAMPMLTVVDEDYGQLNSDQATYPVNFPCVLIGTPQTEWTRMGGTNQQGKCVVTIRLAIDCTQGSGSISEQIATRQQLVTQLHRTLQGVAIGSNGGKLSRRTSTAQTLPGSIKVYEAEYEVMLFDTVA